MFFIFKSILLVGNLFMTSQFVLFCILSARLSCFLFTNLFLSNIRACFLESFCQFFHLYCFAMICTCSCSLTDDNTPTKSYRLVTMVLVICLFKLNGVGRCPSHVGIIFLATIRVEDRKHLTFLYHFVKIFIF